MNLHVNEIKVENNKVIVMTEEPVINVTAAGTMVVDSDHEQFVYLLDDGENYHHLRFVKDTWPMMKEYLHIPWYLYGTVELERFQEEFEFLLENIKDNHNYGKTFVETVETAFSL